MKFNLIDGEFTPRDVLVELLRLYDLRIELAKHEEQGTMSFKEMKKALVRYGNEKKHAWEAARVALDNSC